MSALQVFVMINAVMACLMSGVLHFLGKGCAVGTRGLKEWVTSPLLSFIASLLYATQGGVHHLLSMALPNILVVTAVWVQVLGTYRFYGKSFNKTYFYISLTLSIGFFIFASGKPEYFKERVMYVSGAVFLIFSTQLWLLWKNRKSSMAAGLMLLTLMVVNAVMLLRFATAWRQEIGGSLFDFSLVQSVYLGVFSFGIVLLSISSILFVAEQGRRDMERMLNEDVLTQAKSRRAILEMLESEIDRVKRASSKLSILMMDLDYFKKINDEHGHIVGDQVLKSFVDSVKKVVRRPSEIGRYGGEEFLVVLPDTSADQAVKVAERIREVIKFTAPMVPKYSVSIGVEEWGGVAAKSMNEFIRRADDALYVAKRAGRDCVVLAGTAEAGSMQKARC